MAGPGDGQVVVTASRELKDKKMLLEKWTHNNRMLSFFKEGGTINSNNQIIPTHCGAFTVIEMQSLKV